MAYPENPFRQNPPQETNLEPVEEGFVIINGEKVEAPKFDTAVRDPFEPMSEKEYRRMLGMDIIYSTFSDTEKLSSLGSEERVAVYESMRASTMPHHERAEQKRGIVSEIIRKNVISEEILKNFPIVYLGSGSDINYPLAIGGRNIVLVDMAVSDENNRHGVLRRLSEVFDSEISNPDGNEFSFSFDFGDGPEEVLVSLESGMYAPMNEEQVAEYGEYVLPDKVGAILTFVLNSPLGFIKINDEALSHLVDGGVIIEDSRLIRVSRETGQRKETLIGIREE